MPCYINKHIHSSQATEQLEVGELVFHEKKNRNFGTSGKQFLVTFYF